MADNSEAPCPHCGPGAAFDAFETVREVGVDPTEGRYADATILRCRTCGEHWVNYHVEYEAFTDSGRWARGIIAPTLARMIQPEAVAAYLAGLPSHIFGGSYFGHAGAVGHGPIPWS